MIGEKEISKLQSSKPVAIISKELGGVAFGNPRMKGLLIGDNNRGFWTIEQNLVHRDNRYFFKT